MEGHVFHPFDSLAPLGSPLGSRKRDLPSLSPEPAQMLRLLYSGQGVDFCPFPVSRRGHFVKTDSRPAILICKKELSRLGTAFAFFNFMELQSTPQPKQTITQP
jgi:hypothetical protein